MSDKSAGSRMLDFLAGRGARDKSEYPNMPKRQPCPDCHRGCKRERKTLTGAFYQCPIHGSFLVVSADRSRVPG